MKRFFARNLDNRGRWVRAAEALLLFLGAGFSFATSRWLSAALALAGLFALFEAWRGWCVLRACGLKTKL